LGRHGSPDSPTREPNSLVSDEIDSKDWCRNLGDCIEKWTTREGIEAVKRGKWETTEQQPTALDVAPRLYAYSHRQALESLEKPEQDS